MSQRDLAAKAGIHQPQVVRVERGDDMLVSRLLDMARLVDRDVVLVPRSMRPAVDALIRSSEIQAPGRAQVTAADLARLPSSESAAIASGAFDTAVRDRVDESFDSWAREWPMVDPEVFAVLARLSRAGRHIEEATERIAAIHGMKGGEVVLLGALRRSGPPYESTPTGLKKLFWLSLPGIKKRLDRLEHLGMVERLPNVNDRRGSLVRLTAEGHAALDDLVAHPSRAYAAILALPAEERAQLSALLRRLLSSLDAPSGSPY